MGWLTYTALPPTVPNATRAVQLKGRSGGFPVHREHRSGLGMEMALLSLSGEKGAHMSTAAHVAQQYNCSPMP